MLLALRQPCFFCIGIPIVKKITHFFFIKNTNVTITWKCSNFFLRRIFWFGKKRNVWNPMEIRSILGFLTIGATERQFAWSSFILHGWRNASNQTDVWGIRILRAYHNWKRHAINPNILLKTSFSCATSGTPRMGVFWMVFCQQHEFSRP